MKRTGPMKTLRDRETQTKEETTSYVTLFCALMMVEHSTATLEQAIRIVPLTGKAKRLAEELANENPRRNGRDRVDAMFQDLVQRYICDSHLPKLSKRKSV